MIFDMLCEFGQAAVGLVWIAVFQVGAGLPVSVPAMTIDRQCSSGLMTIATAAKQVLVDNMDICVAGGVESAPRLPDSPMAK